MLLRGLVIEGWPVPGGDSTSFDVSVMAEHYTTVFCVYSLGSIRFSFLFLVEEAEEEEEEEFNRLPWLGQSGRAAAGCACTAAVLRC